MNYLQTLQVQFGIPIWLLVAIFTWAFVWKLLAMWKSAKKSHVAWFIVLALVNTVGILEILYIYIFSDMNNKNKKVTKKKTVEKPLRGRSSTRSLRPKKKSSKKK